MTTALYREFVLSSPQVGASLVNFLKQNAGSFADKGAPLRVIVTEEEMDRLDVQIAYYFGPLMAQVTAQAWVEGRQYSKEVWHELFAKMFLPFSEITLPDGEIVIKRGSVARGKISLKKMNAFLLQIESYCAQELGVVFEDERVFA